MKKWVVSFKPKEFETEKLLFKLFQYLKEHRKVETCVLEDIDATGKKGSHYTYMLNETKARPIHIDELIQITQEDGQVIEMQVSVYNSQNKCEYRINVVDGYTIDLLGIGEIPPKSMFGEYQVMDSSLFNWDSP